MTSGGYTFQELTAMVRAKAARARMEPVDEDWTNDCIGLKGAEDLVPELDRHHLDLLHAGWLRSIADGWGSCLLWVTGLEGIGDFGQEWRP